MINIALQLWSVREDCARNLPETLKSIAKMGYTGVEFAGYYEKTAKELKKILDDVGLKAVGTHLAIDPLLGDELKKTVEFNHVIGNKYLIVAGLKEERSCSKPAWLETAKLMNEISGKVKPEKMRIGYHNHANEFKHMNGELPWDIFFKAANPDIIMQLDAGNAMMGGVSADGLLDILNRYPDRAVTVHLKDYLAKDEKVLLGEGEANIKKFISLCETHGKTEWYIVEQSRYAFTPMECVERCINNLKTLLK
ncbi:MAG: sugar phosphate isomerase/epimerase [Elusimicrobia bacterium]|nr:sugar phosphate isomerase/epimerase [Elusimicrobiota bacterium]